MLLKHSTLPLHRASVSCLESQPQPKSCQSQPQPHPQPQITLNHTTPTSSPGLSFTHPFTMCIAGPSSCGKSTWLKNVLEHGFITPTPSKIIWCYREWQPLYADMMRVIPNITFIQGVDIPEVDTRYPHLVVLDDLMTEVTKNKDVSNMFTVGSHHKNMSVICLLQHLFYHGKENRP